MPGRTRVFYQTGSFPMSVCFPAGLIHLMPKVTTKGVIASIRNGTGLADHGVTFLLGFRLTSLMGQPATISQPHRTFTESGVSMDYSTDEMMTVSAARMLRDRAVCFVG